MPERVVVGGSPLALQIARGMADWPGTVYVLTHDEESANSLKEEGFDAHSVASTDAIALAEIAHAPSVVILFFECVEDPTAAIATWRDVAPDACIVGVRTDSSQPANVPADRLIDTAVVTAQNLSRRVIEDRFFQTIDLSRVFGSLEEPIAIVMHDNPDPDAIAAAYGMRRFAQAFGKVATPVYAGEITHQENRAFINLLELELTQVTTEDDMADFESTILVDHAHPGINDQLSPDRRIDIIIDHHPAREEAEAAYVDRRHHVGATSTLVADHLLTADIQPDSDLATALWFGIYVDTNGFRRGISDLDFTVGAALRPFVDTDLLDRIESPQMTASALETISSAITNRRVSDGVLISDVGDIRHRDALAQAAETVLQMEGVATVAVFGSIDDMIYVSARTSDERVDLGEAIRLAYGRIGSAGGHEDMAGAQIPLGSSALNADDDWATQRRILEERFFEGVTIAKRPPPSGHIEHDQLL